MTAACLLVRSPACSARQLQTSIVQVVHLCPTGFRKEPCERLERHKPKGLRVVLRGLGSSNAPRLPGGGGGDVTSLPDPQGSNPLGPPGPELNEGAMTDLVIPRRFLVSIGDCYGRPAPEDDGRSVATAPGWRGRRQRLRI